MKQGLLDGTGNGTFDGLAEEFGRTMKLQQKAMLDVQNMAAGGAHTPLCTFSATHPKRTLRKPQKCSNSNAGWLWSDRRDTTVADIDKEITEMQGMLSEMQREIDKQANKRAQADMRSLQQKKQKELKVAMQNFDRIKLGMTKDAGGPRSESSRDRMLRLKQVQDNTNARVNRIERSLGETEEVGANTLNRMENQTNRYAKVNDDLKDAAGAIDVAGATNRRLWRGQALDKCIYCFTILVLVGGLGALVYIKFFKPDPK